MRVAVIPLCIAMLALAGCAHQPITWHRDNTSQQQYFQDQSGCAMQAESATASYGPGPRARTLGEAIGQGIGQGLEIASRQRSIMILCMQSKGYTQGEARQTTYVEQPAPAGTPPPQTAVREPLPWPQPITSPPPPPPEKGGVFEPGAEKAAAAQNCHTTQPAKLTAKGPGFESYIVSCPNGEALAVRCDFGNCRVLK